MAKKQFSFFLFHLFVQCTLPNVHCFPKADNIRNWIFACDRVLTLYIGSVLYPHILRKFSNTYPPRGIKGELEGVVTSSNMWRHPGDYVLVLDVTGRLLSVGTRLSSRCSVKIRYHDKDGENSDWPNAMATDENPSLTLSPHFTNRKGLVTCSTQESLCSHKETLLNASW